MKVLILAPFTKRALDQLRQSYEITHESWLPDGILQDPIDLGNRLNDENFQALVVEGDFVLKETFELAPNLGFVGVCRGTTSQIDIEDATTHGIRVANTPGRNIHAVAEHTIGLIYALGRRIAESDSYVQSGEWSSPLGAYNTLRSTEINNKVLGIVGFGNIGHAVASLANAIGLNVLTYDPKVLPSETERNGAIWSDLNFLLETSDFVSVHIGNQAPDDPLFDAEILSKMKRSAFLINTSTPDAVDHHALAAAVKQRQISGAALDVHPTHPLEPNSPLLGLSNVILTPHIAGATEETIERHSEMMVENLLAFASNEEIPFLVNPAVLEIVSE